MISRIDVSWAIYSSLLLFRIIVGPFLLGYVHPDEFFQGGQELYFGCPPTIPWEFEPSNALRSVLPPTLMTWLPLQIYSWIRAIIKAITRRHDMIIGIGKLSGTEVLVVPRIACSLLSVLAIDWSVWYIYYAKQRKENKITGGVPIPVLLLASAWPTMVMLTRPFSNSMETFIVALLMSTVLTSQLNVSFYFCGKIGAICALGVFTRFTFAFFAAPILLLLLKKMVQLFGIRKAILWRKLGWMAISFTCFSFLIVMADTIFYSLNYNEENKQPHHYQDLPSLFNFTSLVITPYNNFLYNSKTSNLKDHGLHPRWTHAVVNMLIMYGPLALAIYVLMATRIRSIGRISSSDRLERTSFGQGEVSMICTIIVLSGLGFLSLAPHQEPRFILPLLTPLVLIGEKPIQRFPLSGACLWGFFNFALFILFGVLHQGGVTKSLLAVGSFATLDHQKQPTSWIYMRSYMPPTFLTRIQRDAVDHMKTCRNDMEQGVCRQTSFDPIGTRHDDACQKDKVNIVDLKGSSLDDMWEVIQKELPCSKLSQGLDLNTFLYLVVPFIEEIRKDFNSSFHLSPMRRGGQSQLVNETYKWTLVESYSPHLTTEDLPSFDGSISNFYSMLTLNVFNVSCAGVI